MLDDGGGGCGDEVGKRRSLEEDVPPIRHECPRRAPLALAQPRGRECEAAPLDRHGALDERTLHAGEPVAGGDKWGMNIWLREHARKPRPSGAVTARLEANARTASTRLVSLALTVRPDALRGASPTAVAGLRPCPACGEPVGPLGLCLCRANYST